MKKGPTTPTITATTTPEHSAAATTTPENAIAAATIDEDAMVVDEETTADQMAEQDVTTTTTEDEAATPIEDAIPTMTPRYHYVEMEDALAHFKDFLEPCFVHPSVIEDFITHFRQDYLDAYFIPSTMPNDYAATTTEDDANEEHTDDATTTEEHTTAATTTEDDAIATTTSEEHITALTKTEKVYHYKSIEMDDVQQWIMNFLGSKRVNTDVITEFVDEFSTKYCYANIIHTPRDVVDEA
jgi:hypothetical protein